ncbi:molybdate ABC transporter substrate-binding protein [Roseospira visakhapatnamensis]|uniref:Molybdate transport system substrate-binding protein n=1 Tax=Roseospira visakhapatnamensis TaxID=390880 RepID=A0A7W6RFM7_9PROT|nr:molybdate ABC transporter substrate-binding protein [Roseospira visakhapatnamensis]MBB4267151.1 molybdate transport system substrate-binding protein [Roseospira visakhapatnamensis]
MPAPSPCALPHPRTTPVAPPRAHRLRMLQAVRAVVGISLGGITALGLGLGVLSPTPAHAGETLVAVAANFTAAAREIGAAFTTATGHTATYSFGSTGKLYAQIANGAPYSVFLAADAARPARAEADGLAVAGSRFTYAVGRLVLFSTDPGLVDDSGQVLKTGDVERLAIANPVTAPYGTAAIEVLRTMGVHDALAGRLVRGDSVSQTLQFVTTGNAPLGFVALSQVITLPGGSRWIVPTDLHAPLRQDAVLLTRGKNNSVARAFVAFLKSPEARAIIARYGYGVE